VLFKPLWAEHGDYIGFLCASEGVRAWQVNAFTGGVCPRVTQRAADLNTPSITLANLTGIRVIPRTVTNVANHPENYTISWTDLADVVMAINPTTFSIGIGSQKTQVITFTLRATRISSFVSFGNIMFKGSLGHTVHIPISVINKQLWWYMGCIHHMSCTITHQISFTTIALRNPQPKTIDFTVFQTLWIGALYEILAEKNLAATRSMFYCSVRLTVLWNCLEFSEVVLVITGPATSPSAEHFCQLLVRDKIVIKSWRFNCHFSVWFLCVHLHFIESRIPNPASLKISLSRCQVLVYQRVENSSLVCITLESSW
jgi:hypothetical protein